MSVTVRAASSKKQPQELLLLVPSWSCSYGSWICNYFSTQCLWPPKGASSNPVHGEVYSLQQYVIKVVSDLRQVGAFSPGTPVSSINKTDRHYITKILLKVALNTINTNPTYIDKRNSSNAVHQTSRPLSDMTIWISYKIQNIKNAKKVSDYI